MTDIDLVRPGTQLAAPAPQRPTADALTRVAERLWPAPARVEAVGRRTPRDPETVRELAFLPSARRPRLLVPADDPPAASGAIRRFSAGLGLAERLARFAAGGALRLPAAGWLLADRLRISSPDRSAETIESHLSALLGTEVLVSLGVGALRANQKPVLQVFDTAGRTVAFVKVGDAELSRRLIEREAAALRRVAQRDWRLLRTPAVLHDGDWRDMRLLVTSPVPATARPRFGRATGPPAAAMAELAAGFDGGVCPVAASPLLSRLRYVAEELTGVCSHRLLAALDLIAARDGDVAIRLGGWHGDWTPWNMSMRGRLVGLWDWERFDTGVPAGFDLVHFLVQTAAKRHGITAQVVEGAVAQAGRRLGRHGELIGTLYTAALAARYLRAAQAETGAPLRAQAQLMLRILADRAVRGRAR